LEVTAERSETISTVITVRWTTDVPTMGRVDFGVGEALDLSTPVESEAAREHAVRLLGLPSERDVAFQVVLVEGENEQLGEKGSTRTGALPRDLPRLDVDGTGDSGAYMAVPILGAATVPVLLSPEGEVTWYWQDESGLDVYRVFPSVDGESVLYNAASVSGDPSDASQIVRVALDGSGSSAIDIPLLAHDFVEHPDGTLAAIVVEYREVNGESVRGDQILEIDREGNTEVIWSAWDCLDPAENPGESTGWTFANALDFDAESQEYMLGMRNQSSIVRIDRNTGACLWALGGTGGTLSLEPGSIAFLHQHQFVAKADRLLVFDNAGLAGTKSRVVEYAIDTVANTAEEVWSHSPDPAIFSFVLGDVSYLPGDDILATWSVAGQIDRITPGGDTPWRLNSELGYAFGFNTVLQSLYP
jgi:hypothetical protein